MGKFDDLRKSLNKSKKKLFSKSAAVGSSSSSSDSKGSGDGNGNGNVDHGINSGTTVVNSVDKAEEDGKIIKISSDDLQKILSTKEKMSVSSTTDSVVVPMLRVRTIDSTTTPISGSRGHGSRRRYKSSASMSGSNSVKSKTKQRRRKNNHSQEQTSCGSVISNISNGSGWTTLATSDTVVTTTTTKQYENGLSNYINHMLFIAPVVSIFEDGIMLLGSLTEEGDDDDGLSGTDNKMKNSKSYDRSGGSDDDHSECNNSDDNHDDDDDDDDDSNESDHSGTSDTSSEDSSSNDGGCITLNIPYASSLSMSLNTIPSLLVDAIVRPRPVSSSGNNYNNIGIISESTYDDNYFDDDADDDDVYDEESVDSMQPASAVTAQTTFEQLKQKSAMKQKGYNGTRTIPFTISNTTKRSFVKDHTKDTTTSKQRQQLLLPFKNARQSQSYKRNEIAMKRISPRSSRTATATATATSKTQQLLFLSHDHDSHSLVGIDCGDECRDVINENNRDDQ